MTLVELLSQDGAFLLLGAGAVIGFFAGKAYRFSSGRKGDNARMPDEVLHTPVLTAASLPVPSLAPARTAAVTAAITAAIYKYRNDNP